MNPGLWCNVWAMDTPATTELWVPGALQIIHPYLVWTLPLTAPLPLSSLEFTVSECFAEKSYSFFFLPEIALTACPLLSVCFQFLTEQTHLQAEMSFLTMSMKWISFQIAPVITSICRGNFSLRLIRSVDKNNIMTQKGPVKHLLFQKANIEFPALHLQ